MPSISSVTSSPVADTELKILAISLCNSVGAYFMYSISRLSGPALFLFLSDFAAFIIVQE